MVCVRQFLLFNCGVICCFVVVVDLVVVVVVVVVLCVDESGCVECGEVSCDVVDDPGSVECGAGVVVVVMTVFENKIVFKMSCSDKTSPIQSIHNSTLDAHFSEEQKFKQFSIG